MLRFLAELKQRQVLRVAGLYVVSGWVLFQVVSAFFPALHLPQWSVTLVAALFLIGLPIALVIAYAFETTPEGIRRTGPRDPGATPAPLTWFDWALLATTVLIVGIAVVQFASTAREAAPAPRGGSAGVAPPGASIAVLPFVNFSDAPDGEYFADGLTEELINSLAQLPDLKVAGRTSAFYFKGRNEDLREIGRQLGVAHVLEGSVRRSGDRLRITAQLIDVADGFHRWSQTYDRQMEDAFVVQTEIATAVADVLEARLLGNVAPDGARPARDPKAYELELVARSRLRTHERAELEAARALYQELIALEPDNPRAHAGYAEATILLTQNFLALEFTPARAESMAAVERALALDPQSADAWRVKGLIDHVTSIRTSDQTYAESALAALQRAAELAPDQPETLELLANELLALGQTQQAIPILQRALAIDPLSRLGQHVLGMALSAEGRFAEARRQYERLIALYPGFTSVKVMLGDLLIDQGKLDEAALVLDDPALVRDDPAAGFLLANVYANLEMEDDLRRVLDSIREPPTAAIVAHAALLLRTGQLETLLEYADEQRAATDDPIWRTIGVVAHLVGNDVHGARALLADAMPGLLEDPPATDSYAPMDALIGAYVLRETGNPERARTIAEAVLAAHERAPQEYTSTEVLRIRALAFGVLGRVDDAIASLRAATDGGWRTPIDYDYFVRIDGYPFMREVAADLRYADLIAEIESDHARMRDALLARRAVAELAP